MHKLATTLLLLSVGCSMETTDETSVAKQAVQSTVTRISVNGRSSFVGLLDAEGTNGFLAATEDRIAGTVALDFSWATPNADDTAGILYQGAGQIPSSALVQTATSSHLQLTTPADFTILRCELDFVNGTFICAPSDPLAFNLTWAQNGIGTIEETLKRTETLGPVTTKLKADYTQVSATINGTWGGRSSPNLIGNLSDSQSKTYVREITVQY